LTGVLSPQSVREAELAFLNAPFRKNGWQEAVAQLAMVTGSALAQLCGSLPGLRMPFNLLSEEPHDPYRHLENPVVYGPENWRIGVSAGVLAVRHDHHYSEFRASHRRSFYDDAVSDLDVPFGCQTVLSQTGQEFIGLALLRSHRNGACDAEVLTAFHLLARQAQRALRVQLALGQESAELMLGGLSHGSEATLLLDRFGSLAALSESAEVLFDMPDGLAMDGARLVLARADEARAFDAAISRLILSDGVTGPVIHQFIFGRSESSPGGKWRGVLTRLPRASCELGFAPELALTVTGLSTR
jgi:hypothetical protein